MRSSALDWPVSPSTTQQNNYIGCEPVTGYSQLARHHKLSRQVSNSISQLTPQKASSHNLWAITQLHNCIQWEARYIAESLPKKLGDIDTFAYIYM